MNRLQLKALLLSVITEIKFGYPIANNAHSIKKWFKKTVGLSANASNKRLIEAIKQTYVDNGLQDDFDATIKKFSPIVKQY